MNTQIDYWIECLSEAADECGFTLTQEQFTCLAEAVKIGHECYGMAFYSPPDSDRLAVIERESADKLRRLQAEYDAYRSNAETAVKRALRQYHDAQVTIGEDGEVLRHGGRTERIQ